MTKQQPCPCGATARIADLGRADILVGIPSYNNAATIGHVVRAVEAGLAKYFPGEKAVVLNSDGGSRDGTREAVVGASLHDDSPLLLISHPLSAVQRLTVPYDGIPGKGSAFRCIFRAAEQLGARACAVVDSDLRSITPEWLQLLLEPVLRRGIDFVAPYYLRHKHDGTITNSIVYPLTRGLYGRRVRQPIGGDFGFSGRLASHYLSRPVWETDVARYGIDVWMTTTAVCGDFAVAQAFLGAKLHDAKDPGADLSDMFVQVVGTVLALMEQYEAVWTRRTASEDVPVFGFRFDVGLEPIPVDRARLAARFRSGVENLGEIWTTVFAPADLGELRRLASLREAEFVMEDDLWVRLVYDVACAFRHRVLDRGQLVRSMLPLYMAWVASFVGRVANASAPEVDATIERLCLAFESGKGYLLQRWANPGWRPAPGSPAAARARAGAAA
jgi:glycosyltransferase involved in cell wall biosynthesis